MPADSLSQCWQPVEFCLWTAWTANFIFWTSKTHQAEVLNTVSRKPSINVRLGFAGLTSKSWTQSNTLPSMHLSLRPCVQRLPFNIWLKESEYKKISTHSAGLLTEVILSAIAQTYEMTYWKLKATAIEIRQFSWSHARQVISYADHPRNRHIKQKTA